MPDIRNTLRKLEFPAVVMEALVQLHNLLSNVIGTPVTAQMMQTSNEIIEEYVFFTRKRKKPSCYRDLQILDIICTAFATFSQESCRSIFFVMFPPADQKLLDQRVEHLSRLISLAVTLKVDNILDCAAFWLHVTGVNSQVSLRIVDSLIGDLLDNGSSVSLTDSSTSIVKTSPAFCATFVTVASHIYHSSHPPTSFLEIVAAWLDVNPFLCFVPLETVMPTAQTFIPGLITWTVLPVNANLPSKQVIINTNLIHKLHLCTLRVLLKAPQATLQSSHLNKLSVLLLESKADSECFERFLHILQAALSSKCIAGSLSPLSESLKLHPPNRLLTLILNNNKGVLV